MLVMVSPKEVSEGRPLSPEEKNRQNQEAYKFLLGLLGDLDSRTIDDWIEIKKGPYCLTDVMVTFKRPDRWRSGIERETFTISQWGLEDVLLVRAPARTVSGLDLSNAINRDIGREVKIPIGGPPNFQAEVGLLNDRDNSDKTAAKIIVESLISRIAPIRGQRA